MGVDRGVGDVSFGLPETGVLLGTGVDLEGGLGSGAGAGSGLDVELEAGSGWGS